MYRVRSTDLWYNAPGVVAAYQPIAAPDAFAARQNVSNDLRRVGVYAAKIGVAPTWSGAQGWTFNGTTQYFTTGVIPSSHWSIIVRFAKLKSTSSMIVGSRNGIGIKEFGLWPNSGANRVYSNGSRVTISGGYATGVAGIADRSAYIDGAVEASSIPVSPYSGDYPILIGGFNNAGTPVATCDGIIVAYVVVRRTLSASEMWLYSRQMAYCNVNPDWSAWGRRRQYFYAPSQMAGFQAAWAARQNRLIGGGSS